MYSNSLQLVGVILNFTIGGFLSYLGFWHVLQIFTYLLMSLIMLDQ